MRYRRPLLFLLAGLLLGELFYVGAFEWAARSGQLARWINRRPDKFHMVFASAHSFFPFRVALERVDISVQTPRLQWRLQCDQVSGWIPPAPLLLRRLRVEAAKLEGAEFGLRWRDGTPADSSLGAPELPPIPAFPISGTPPGPAKPRQPAWSFEFPRITATEVRSIWLEHLHLTGEMHAKGGFAIRRRREAEVGESRLELTGGTLTLAGEPLAQGLRGSLGFSTMPYAYREHRGLDALPFLNSSATLEGEIFAGTVLRRYLARAPWIELENVPTTFDAALEVRQGALTTGSHLHTRKGIQTVRLFGFEARGTALMRFDVRSDAAGERADLLLSYDDFELRRRAAGPAVVAGTGLLVLATTRDLRPRDLPDDGKVKIDLGQAHLLDLAGFSDLLPPSAGLTLAGGKGEVRGSLEAEIGGGGGGGETGGGSGAGSARGAIFARLTDAALISNGVRFTGGLELDVPITSTDLTGRKFDLSGARIGLTDFRSPTPPPPPSHSTPPNTAPPAAPGWWGRIKVASAELRLVEPPTAQGKFVVHLRDSVPLVELYATRKELPKWVERLLEEPDVQATGSFAYRKPELTIQGLKARFEHWGFDADLELRKDRRRGLLLLEWRKLALGVRIDGDQRTYKLVGAREWFAKEKL